MLWPSMKTMRTFHFTRLQQSLESIVPRFSPGFSNTAPANVPARRPCATNAKETTDSERIRQLEKENAKLREERDILRKAAKYFAEETRW
ncbi:transposase [Corynebacterium jeikeium]|nr:transposase [Corynebacterium jeikeium]